MTVESILKKPCPLPIDPELIAQYILDVQRQSGEIPWYENGKTDPWDHVEGAMGLTVARCRDAAKRAYEWSCNTQLEDGSWWSEYHAERPAPGAHKDTNMSAYIAVGVLHYFFSTGDVAFLKTMWPTVKRAIDFVLTLQGPGGEVYWAKRADGSTSQRALLTGSSSIFLSLCCAVKISSLLGFGKDRWASAAYRLGNAIQSQPHLFDQTKARYAMDWYYPILSGALRGAAARHRLKGGWRKFVIDGWGVRCVSDASWITMAETAELVITLAAVNRYDHADTLFHWICENQYENGAFWTGITVPERRIYTKEQTTWTGAAVLLAMDMLYDITPSWRIFSYPGANVVPVI